MVQENNSLRLRIYSYNQKGRSAAYLLPDFIIGSTAYKTGEWHYQQPDGAAEKRTAQFALIDGWCKDAGNSGKGGIEDWKWAGGFVLLTSEQLASDGHWVQSIISASLA